MNNEENKLSLLSSFYEKFDDHEILVERHMYNNEKSFESFKPIWINAGFEITDKYCLMNQEVIVDYIRKIYF